MILHHRLEHDHEVSAVLRHHRGEAPWLSTVRTIEYQVTRERFADPRTGKPCVVESSSGSVKVPGQVTIAEAGDWVLTEATPAERRKLAGLGFVFAGHVEPAGVQLNTSNRTGAVEHEPEVLARAHVNGRVRGGVA